MPTPPPWKAAPPTLPAFVVPWATGPDPALDGVFRVLALRPADEGWAAFDAWCAPFDPPDEGASARMAHEFGVRGADLAGARPPREVWAELDLFLGQAPVVAPDGEAFAGWAEALGGRPRVALGLSELAALLLPGRMATRREGLVRALLREHDGPPAALLPNELVQALGELVRRGLDRDPRVHALAAAGYGAAHLGLCASDPPAAERLAFALSLVEHPTRWARSTGQLFHPGEGLFDGQLSSAAKLAVDPTQLLEELDPAVSGAYAAWSDAEQLPPDPGGPAPFDARDRSVLEQVFEHHLPAALATELGGQARDYLRPSQVEVARAVVDTLGADELLLVHAPTGTGKTLAYLVPALLWARRHGVRVGVATYTRALQEQAMDSEVPRALAALARAGVAGPTRVSVLKGRENYLCYRALRAATPDEDEDAEGWLAWTQLALFALTDREGDLDRLPREPPVRLTSSDTYRARSRAAVAGVRARTGCCTHAKDRATCAAELARRRAERSHVVLTNQSFALARQEFFRHLVFDECEHLHDVAAAAWSHALHPRRLRGLLRRLHTPGGGPARAPLDRLRTQLMPGTCAGDEAQRATAGCGAATRALAALEVEACAFESWRAGGRRGEDEQHLALREYLDGEHGAGLLAARVQLGHALAGLETALARVVEASDGLPLRGAGRLRRALELARADLVATLEDLDAWLPLDEGAPRLSRATFYDIDRDHRDELVLRASVLLPNEVLGRAYYPELGSAAFLSATTRLAGGFEAARGYLGLDRAELPAEDEQRQGRRVRCAQASEVFDYSRVLVGLPRDVPEPRDKAAHLDFVVRFLDWLGERTRGRILALFTNQADVRGVGQALAPRFRARRVPLWYQGMAEAGKEELSALFRERVDSVLLGVDTFWFGADFPGPTLEYLVIVRLPYGVPDRYHHAQRAALGAAQQRSRIYLPRALAKFRQGFGRLMRRTSDRGCVFVLDRRLTDRRHRFFLEELPLAGGIGAEPGARLVRGDATQVLREGLAHMGMLADLERRGLSPDFEVARRAAGAAPPVAGGGLPEPTARIDVPIEDLPF